MKRVLSLVLTALLIVSVAVVGISAITVGESGATVSTLLDSTYVDTTNSANVSVAYGTDYATVTTDANGTSTRYLAVNFNGSYVVSDYAYVAFRYRTTAATSAFVDSIAISTTATAYGSAGSAAAATYIVSDGYWNTAIIPLTTAAFGSALPTSETLAGLRIPMPGVGKTVDISWVGAFKTQALAERYAAYFAAKHEGGYYAASESFSYDFTGLKHGGAAMDAIAGFNDRWVANYNAQDYYGIIDENGDPCLRMGNPWDGITDVSSIVFDKWYAEGTSYSFSAQIKLAFQTDAFAGMMINFGSEGNDTVDAMYETYKDTSDAYHTVGKSGIGIALHSQSVIRVIVHTGTSTLDTPIYADLGAADGLMNGFHEFKAVDDGEGTITLTFGSLPLGTVVYSNPQSVAGLNETYYRTVMIYDSSDTLRAQTTTGLVSTMKSFAIGQRASCIHVDDIAVSVTGPEREVIQTTPTELTLAEGTTSYFKTLNNVPVMVVKPTFSGSYGAVYLNDVLSSVNEGEYVKVYNASGTEITSTTARLQTGYTVSLVDADGNAVEGQSYKLAVLGDFDNNGRVNASDYAKIKTVVSARASGYTITTFMALGTYTEAQFAAANVANGTRINAASYGAVKTYVDNGAW